MTKITLTDGTIFEGTAAEYVEFVREVSEFAKAEAVKAVEPAEHSFKVGDKAILKSEHGALFGFEAGETVVIADLDSGGTYKFHVRNGEGVGGFTNPSNLEPITTAEPALKVGDYAKITRDVNEHREGDIARITDRGLIFDFRIDYVVKDDYGYIDAKNITKATDAEVAAAKAAQAEAERWAKIGRNVNEFRKGDIIEVDRRREIYTQHKPGEIGVVVSDMGDDRPLVKINSLEQFSVVKLVTPVEARFDRN